MVAAKSNPLRSLARAAAHSANGVLGRFGLNFAHYSDISLEGALNRLALHPVAVNTVIDIGASDARWTKRVRPYFPDAHYLLVDANETHKPALKAYAESHPRTSYIIGAAGNAEGEIFFDVSDPLGGAAYFNAYEGTIRVPMTTIDHQVTVRSLPAPFFLKLDTHGFELPILEGCEETLPQTALLLIESYNFRTNERGLMFHEMIAYLKEKGFRVADLINPLHRPRDGILWQFDLFFMRAERDEFKMGTYS